MTTTYQRMCFWSCTDGGSGGDTDLRSELATSRSELELVKAELEQLRACLGASSSDGGAGPAAAAALSTSRESDEGVVERDFICFRGFRVGDKVLFRRRDRGGKQVYAALLAGSRHCYLDRETSETLLAAGGFEEVLGEVTLVADSPCDPSEVIWLSSHCFK